MNKNDYFGMPVAIIEPWSADQWAERWRREADARNRDFKMWQQEKHRLLEKIRELEHQISLTTQAR